MSRLPPAVSGTTTRTARLGYSPPCASAAAGSSAISDASSARSVMLVELLHARDAHVFGVLPRLIGEEPAEFLGRGRSRDDAQALEPLHHGRVGEHGADLLVQALDDRRGRLRRGEHAEPAAVDLEAR